MTDFLSASSSSRVILKDSATWNSWLANIESIAVQYDVWELCDPTTEKEPTLLKTPTSVITVEEAEVKYGTKWVETLQMLQTQYTIRNADYIRQKKGMYLVATAIRNSVHTNYQPFIIDQKTPRDLLKYLRQRFLPECDTTTAARLRQLWGTVDCGLDKNTDIDKWLLNWETVQARYKRAKIPEADDAPRQFLDAISVMSPGFHEIWTLRMLDKAKEEANQVTFTELLNRYKAHWSITYGNQATSTKGVSKAAF
ncbi:hypothetical protein N7465_003619 [Penicillium sp. CMV-2018d]|nr:hypothetical protein N7465_003619 [Penicillium sp. CMV-2018d]